MITKLSVRLELSKDQSLRVGDMHLARDARIYFQYDDQFLAHKFNLSPLKLSLTNETQTVSEKDFSVFDGLFGVFADSLPDGWGLLLMSRAMKKLGLNFQATSGLDRLAYIGRTGLGALTYHPELSRGDSTNHQDAELDLVRLAQEVQAVIQGKSEDVLTELIVLGGSPGGARPKVLVGIGGSNQTSMISGAGELPPPYQHWIIKFRGADERNDASKLEYIYSIVARSVGINVPETRLFQDRSGEQWFGIKRFDRGEDSRRIHVHTLAGLTHANFRLPSMDYDDILRATSFITKKHDDLIAALRVMIFNVVFHNRDDHAKNFSYIMNTDGTWRFAPSYDLTYAPGLNGEHMTAIMGEGRRPGGSHIAKIAASVGIARKQCSQVLSEVQDGVKYMQKLLKEYGIKNHPISSHLKLWQ